MAGPYNSIFSQIANQVDFPSSGNLSKILIYSWFAEIWESMS